MNFSWRRSLKFKITFIFTILIAIVFSLNWMVAVQTMHSEKVGDIQKVLNHLLRESSEEHLKKPLTLTSDLSFLYVLYSVPHNKMILNDS